MLFGVRVIVIVPAFEEAPRIGRVLASMPVAVDHVLVVDDASRDATSDAARAARDPRVEVLRHATNRGVGAAIVTGYRRAEILRDGARAVLVVMAGDGQMHPDDMPGLVRPVAVGHADYVKGNRFAWPRGSRGMPVARYAGGLAFSWLTAAAIGVPISDSQCGYTALDADAARKLDLDDLWPGYGYPNDLLGQLAARGLRIAEVPVRPVYADEVSRLRLRHLPTIGRLIARAWARRRRARG